MALKPGCSLLKFCVCYYAIYIDLRKTQFKSGYIEKRKPVEENCREDSQGHSWESFIALVNVLVDWRGDERKQLGFEELFLSLWRFPRKAQEQILNRR